MIARHAWTLLAALSLGCGAAPRPGAAPAPAPGAAGTAAPTRPATPPPGAPGPATRAPELPPPVAFAAGLMPLRSTGVDQFLAKHPTYDGRGVLIGILDTGVDPGVDGLITTSTGAPKIVELRDFSGEGLVALTPVTPQGDSVRVGGRALGGAGRIARLTSATTWYAGVLRELPLGKVPGADLNGDGNNTDVFPVVVVRATDGWVAFLDSNLNDSFEDEMPLHDYRQGHETIALGTKPITLAANFAEVNGVPVLDFVFDNFSHGTHVAGIAAGHALFNVDGFDGVAPGAQLLALKVANGARGGVTVTGSMQRALEYAAAYAARRGMPLVLNLSFGVGNEFAGRAVIDSIVNAFLLAHPDIVLTISAGNDGPGLSTVGFPGSADLALSVGAVFPGAFARPVQPGTPPAADAVGWWSSRGGALAKPDLVTPGVAFSTVPRWDTGSEIKGGTSMAAPHAAGLAACLLSALLQEGRRVSAAELVQSLRATATPFAGATVLDEGAGLPHLEAAYRWLLGEHQGSEYLVHTAAGGSALFLRDGPGGPSDTLRVFRVRHVAGLRAAEFALKSNASWLSVPAVVPAGARETEIPVTLRPGAFAAPGVYVAAVSAWNANDSLAGALFRLPSTVVVPHDLATKPLDDERRAIAAARVQRYFLRAARPGATLQATVTLPDSLTERATARLYEPNGEPFRDREEVALGHGEPGTARFTVRAEDLVPGVYELDVFAPPLAAATATVTAALAPVALLETGAGVELSNSGDATVAARTSVTLLGAERRFAVTGRGAPAESLTVRVPGWAQRVGIDVEMPREQWDEFTDFGVTEFDSAGQQVGQGALNYAVGRHGFDVPGDLKDRPVTIELFPAFARERGGQPWRATVRVRFLLKEPRPAGDGRDVTVVGGGRVAVPLGKPPALTLPVGAGPLVELRVRPTAAPAAGAGGAAGADAVRRVALQP
jgi:tripeptidyl-peptidase II